jgi:hypothetical protein
MIGRGESRMRREEEAQYEYLSPTTHTHKRVVNQTRIFFKLIFFVFTLIGMKEGRHAGLL